MEWLSGTHDLETRAKALAPHYFALVEKRIPVNYARFRGAGRSCSRHRCFGRWAHCESGSSFMHTTRMSWDSAVALVQNLSVCSGGNVGDRVVASPLYSARISTPSGKIEQVRARSSWCRKTRTRLSRGDLRISGEWAQKWREGPIAHHMNIGPSHRAHSSRSCTHSFEPGGHSVKRTTRLSIAVYSRRFHGKVSFRGFALTRCRR